MDGDSPATMDKPLKFCSCEGMESSKPVRYFIQIDSILYIDSSMGL